MYTSGLPLGSDLFLSPLLLATSHIHPSPAVSPYLLCLFPLCLSLLFTQPLFHQRFCFYTELSKYCYFQPFHACRSFCCCLPFHVCLFVVVYCLVCVALLTFFAVVEGVCRRRKVPQSSWPLGKARVGQELPTRWRYTLTTHTPTNHHLLRELFHLFFLFLDVTLHFCLSLACRWCCMNLRISEGRRQSSLQSVRTFARRAWKKLAQQW